MRTSVGRFGSNVRANGTRGPRLLKVSCAGRPGRNSAQVASPPATTTASAMTTSGTTPMLRPFSITAANWWLIARVTGRTCRSVPPGTAGRCSTSARSCATTVAGSSRSRTRSVTAVSGRTTRRCATTGSSGPRGGRRGVGRATGGAVAAGFESTRRSVTAGRWWLDATFDHSCRWPFRGAFGHRRLRRLGRACRRGWPGRFRRTFGRGRHLRGARGFHDRGLRAALCGTLGRDWLRRLRAARCSGWPGRFRWAFGHRRRRHGSRGFHDRRLRAAVRGTLGRLLASAAPTGVRATGLGGSA